MLTLAHAGGFLFGLCCGRRGADGVGFVPTFFGAFDATGEANREARCVFECEEE
jgi:hypothetical protein